MDAWNEFAADNSLPTVGLITKERISGITNRLGEWRSKPPSKMSIEDYVDLFKTALEKASHSAFLFGENDRGWVMDFDFLCQRKSFTKLMEGKYRNGRKRKAKTLHERSDELDAKPDVYVDANGGMRLA